MKLCRAKLLALAASVFLTGCATTDHELSQKEKDKIAREMERANRKEAQNQAKMMRDPGQKRSPR